MTQQRAVIFDLDGTLLDTLNDLATSGNELLASRGLPTHPVDAYRIFIGDGMGKLVQRIFPEEIRPADGEETELILAEYRAAYEKNWQATTTMFPGMAELLDQLKADKVPIGVLSNKSHDFTLKCVGAFLSDWEWDVVLGARDGVPRKPEPEAAIEAAEKAGALPENCYFVGDSNVDILTAVNAGMHAVGVSWGFRSVEELRDAGAEVIIDTPHELLNYMNHE